jgi:malonyl CoA-acyl carrier protein transacylase
MATEILTPSTHENINHLIRRLSRDITSVLNISQVNTRVAGHMVVSGEQEQVSE